MIMCQIKDEDRGEDGKMKKRPICTYVDNSKLRDMCKIVENKNKNLEIESNQNVAVENNQTEMLPSIYSQPNLVENAVQAVQTVQTENSGLLIFEGKFIANFTVSIVNMYIVYDEDMKNTLEASYDIICHVNHRGKVETYNFNGCKKNELLNGEFINKIPTVIKDVSPTEYIKIYQKYINILISNYEGTVITMIENSGWVNYEGYWLFVTSQGVIGDYNKHIVSRDGFFIKKIPSIDIVNEFDNMRSVLKEEGQMDVILLYLLSQTIHSLFNAKSVDIKHILFIVGPRGSRKTSISLCFTQLVNKDKPKYNFQATSAGINYELKVNKDRIMLIDDLAPSLDSSAKKDKEKLLESIIRLFGDSTERVINTRFMRYKSEKIEYKVKGGAVVTGEYFYGAGTESSIARAVVVEIEENSVDLEKLSYYQKHPEILESLVYEFIEFVYMNQKDVLNILSNKVDEYRQYSANNKKFSNGRYWEYFGQYMATAEILGMLFTNWRGVSNERVQSIINSLGRGVLTVLEKNDRAMRTENPASVIINTILDLLESGRFIRWGEAISENTPLVLGDDAVYFRQKDLLDMVKAYTKKNGINFITMSNSEIAKILKTGGYCEEYMEGNKSRYGKKYKGYGNERLMHIKKEKLGNILSELSL